ncbi:GNAT family N-acetyltransferase [Sphingomonas psychrotolerans]|uniref:GNAT family N-acetyltransferase n=1 Tax=Sphingomonas psychrotolerans TaxID=1327635 RepID=A0A2K8MD00_9SPHN|nr:N-acetyltransferase [Sphingomonas psychrotolerans]ATY31727.1 GNAT family N-acetyltransferase [Sphingomonas psychrotolerans]
MIALVPLAAVDPEAVEALLDRAFGPERRTRTAYRIRGGTLPVPELSFAALDSAEKLLGTIQCWPVALACDGGDAAPLVMVGPVAVEPERQQGGIGRALMERMLDAVPDCTAPGCGALMLIGDPEYYGRFFGFTAERTSGWRLPGPFEPRRLLARGDSVPDCAGVLGPRVRQAA